MKIKRNHIILAIVLIGILYFSGALFSIVNIYHAYSYDIQLSNTPTKTSFLVSESPSFVFQNEEYTQTCTSCSSNGYCIVSQIQGITVDGNTITNPDNSIHSYYYTMTNNVPKTISAGSLGFTYAIPTQTAGEHTIVVTTWSKWIARTFTDSCEVHFNTQCAPSPVTGISPCVKTFTDPFTVSGIANPPPPTVNFWTSIGSYISSFLGNLVCAFKQLIGQTC